jgi:DNA-3-methyladenine glycosylase
MAAESLLKPVINQAFFTRSVHEVAPDLIGAILTVDGVGGVIVEVEAYHHTDPASHSYRGMTPRNAIMFGPPGYIYVYRSYGIHWCVNIVCEDEGSASAVLIRALEPRHGVDLMQQRRGMDELRLLCAGPGRVCQALGIIGADNGARLNFPAKGGGTPSRFILRPRIHDAAIVSGPRIGISKAVDAPWRFGLRGSPYVSKPFPE